MFEQLSRESIQEMNERELSMAKVLCANALYFINEILSSKLVTGLNKAKPSISKVISDQVKVKGKPGRKKKNNN
jgi:hypothetical protein